MGVHRWRRCGVVAVWLRIGESPSTSGEPRCWRQVPYEQSWLFGRLNGISSDGQGTFGSIDDEYRMTRYLENKKALASSERMLVDHARTPVNGGENCDRELVWKRKAECIGSGDELVDVALWVGFVDVVSAKLVRRAGTRRESQLRSLKKLSRADLWLIPARRILPI